MAELEHDEAEAHGELSRWESLNNADPEWVELYCAGAMGAAGVSLILAPILAITGALTIGVSYGLLALFGSGLPLLGLVLVLCAVFQVQAMWRRQFRVRLVLALIAAGWCLFTVLLSFQLAGVAGIVLSMGRVLLYAQMCPAALWLPGRLLRARRAALAARESPAGH